MAGQSRPRFFGLLEQTGKQRHQQLRRRFEQVPDQLQESSGEFESQIQKIDPIGKMLPPSFSAIVHAGENMPNIRTSHLQTVRPIVMNVPPVRRYTTNASDMTTFSQPEIAAIAAAQKRVLWLLLVSMPVAAAAIIPLPEFVFLLLFPALLVIGVAGAILTYRLARAIHDPVPWLYVICAFIPWVGTATLLVLNVRATAALRASGIEVGLMGARVPASPE